VNRKTRLLKKKLKQKIELLLYHYIIPQVKKTNMPLNLNPTQEQFEEMVRKHDAVKKQQEETRSRVIIRKTPDDVDCHARVLDRRRFMLSTNGVILGNCVSSSLRTYYKMRKVGAVRVRGKRCRERDDDAEMGTNKNWHYWVENKGMCFDLSGGLQQIYKKEDYYRLMTVSESHEADLGGLFSDEIKNKLNKRTINHLKNLSDQELDELVKIYEEEDKI
jgi:hypothetical protein